jgi:hypothetical protein
MLSAVLAEFKGRLECPRDEKRKKDDWHDNDLVSADRETEVTAE